MIVASGNQVATLSDWQFQIGAPFLSLGDHSLPHIRNSEERSFYRKEGNLALVIPYRVKNASPVARRGNFGLRLKDTLGEHRGWGPYNAKMWAKELGVKTQSDQGKFPPNKWVDLVVVMDAQEEGVDGAALYFNIMETRRYSTGKKYKVAAYHMLLELPEVTRREGPPPWLEAKAPEK
jgi:hypothetical protein